MGEREILKLENLSFTVNGRKILDQITINFWPGQVHALVGPNGVGKSTLASTIMGLEGYRDIQGDIFLEGKSIKAFSLDERARRGITLAWQEPARYEGLTVEKFIKAAAVDKSSESVGNALWKVGLNPEEYVSRALDKTLSGGERKKIELASILVMRPKVVLLDEPDSGIDVASLQKIFEAIKLLKSLNSTVILITHSLTVLRQAEHAFLMCHGKIIEKGSVKKISPYFEEKCIPCEHKNRPNNQRETLNEI